MDRLATQRVSVGDAAVSYTPVHQVEQAGAGRLKFGGWPAARPSLLWDRVRSGNRRLRRRAGRFRAEGVVKGFKEFLMRGNLIELAVAVIVGAVFTNLVTSFTNMLMDVIGKLGKVPDFSRTSLFGVGVGAFLSAVLAFLFTSSIVYFFIVLPYNWLTRMWKPPDQRATASTEELLAEIRDILRERQPLGPAREPDGVAVTDVDFASNGGHPSSHQAA
jgi:large conductance mechanosensitive channel